MFIYFNSTERCKAFNNLLLKKGCNCCDYLIGDNTYDKRKRIKKGVQSNTISIVSLCGMFNEGISIDNLQTVYFWRFKTLPY